MDRSTLNKQNIFSYICALAKQGLQKSSSNPVSLIFMLVYWTGTGIFLASVLAPATGFLEKLFQPIAFIAVVIGAAGLFITAMIATAVPPCAYKIAQAFANIGMTNSARTPPLAVSYSKNKERRVIELISNGISIEEYQKRQPEIESALNCRITKIEEGRDKQHIILHLAPGDAKLPEVVKIPVNLEIEASQILLGDSLDGAVSVNLNKTPHLLIGGSTGSGKTTLIKSIIAQCLEKKANVTLIDLKGGQDYPPRWKGHDCSFCNDAQDALATLSGTVKELNSRKIKFNQISDYKGVPCGDLDTYNNLCPTSPLTREVIVIDEIAELTDTTGMDKPHKELVASTVANLSTIARLGRAFGINLIIGTQRPDATACPGQIKNNMDCRICGKADNTLSMIILDNTDAADRIPKDSQGLFLNQEGVLFRAYLYD